MRVPFPRIAISGFGCVSPLGVGLRSTVENLRHSRDSVSPVRLFPVDKCLAKTAGQVDENLREVATSILARSKRWTRAAQMILVAMAEALAAKPRFVPDCVVIGTTSGGMSLGEQFYRSLASGSPAWSATRKVRAYAPQEPVMQAMSLFGFTLARSHRLERVRVRNKRAGPCLSDDSCRQCAPRPGRRV